MRNIFLLLFFSMLIVCCLNPNHSTEERWIVTTYKSPGIAAWDENDASRYIGKGIIISDKTAIVFGDTCNDYSLKKQKVNTVKYLDAEYGDYDKFDFSFIPKDSVIVKTITCHCKPIYTNKDSLDFNYDLIEINSSEIIVPINGIYFVLKKKSDIRIMF